MAQRLTDKAVKALPAPARGNQISYDTEIKGFGARVTAAGAIAFIINYRRKSDGLERRYTIESRPDWSVAAAREEAKRLKRQSMAAATPLVSMSRIAPHQPLPSVCPVRRRAHRQAAAAHANRISGHRPQQHLPALGKMKVTSVEFEHIERPHAEVTKRAPILANRALAVTAKMFTLAIKWKLRADNPCKGVERNREQVGGATSNRTSWSG